MDPQRAEQFRKLLLEQREQVTAALARQETGDPDPLRDPEEMATRIGMDQVESQRVKDDVNLLAKIELALARLEEGTYDRCARCGGPIPEERLLAKPSVSLCVMCQEEKDAGNLS